MSASIDAADRLRKAKLVLVVPVLDFGGVETTMVIQAALMAPRVGELRVCTLGGFGAAAAAIRDAGVPVDHLELDPDLRNPRTIPVLWRYLRQQRPDIIHVRTGALTIHGLIAGRLARVPVRIAEEVGIPRRGRLGRRLFPLAYRQATRVIGVSESVVRYLIEHDGVPAEKATLIYNAIDERFFDLRSAPPVEARPLRLVTVGRLDPVKGQDVLLAAARDRIRDGSAVLTIVGDGPSRQHLVELSRQLDIDHGVTFRGHCTDVDRELSEADVFVLPSRSEGFGLAVVEAMAARLPVIATAVGGVPEVLAESPGVEFLVKPDDPAALADALDRMLSTPLPLRERMGLELHRAADRFRPSPWVDALAQLYAGELARAGRAR